MTALKLRQSMLLIMLSALLNTGCASFSQSQADHEKVVRSRQLTQQGIHAMQRENWAQAEKLLQEAKKNSPYDTDTMARYAETLWNQQAYDRSIFEMQNAIQLSGDEPSLMIRLGNMYLERGETALAAEQAENAIQINPKLATAWQLLGEVAQWENKPEQARDYYLRALAIDRNLTDVQLRLAKLFRISGEPNRALICLNQIEKQFPAGELPSDVLIEQGITYKTLERFEDAALAFSQAVENSSNTTEIQYQWAECEMLAGRLSRAQWIAQQTLIRDPSHNASRQLLAEIPERQRFYSESLRR